MRNYDSGFAALHRASSQPSAAFRCPEGESEGELVTQIVEKNAIPTPIKLASHYGRYLRRGYWVRASLRSQKPLFETLDTFTTRIEKRNILKGSLKSYA